MAKKTTYSYEPDYAVAPGQTLLEKIEELGMTQSELALRLELAPKTVNQIIKGIAPITHETAIKLENVTGLPAGFWQNREATYREQLVRIENRKRLQADLGWLKTIPVKDLEKRHAIEPTTDNTERLQRVLRFFGVSNVSAWNNYWKNFQVAARRSKCFKTHQAALATWIRIGQLQSQSIQCGPYNRGTFEKSVREIRAMTTLATDTFVPRIKELCATSGVAFALVPEMKQVPWHGASWWPKATKAVIELNLRGKSEDQFWFSFFHEAGHILKGHSKKEVFINDGNDQDPYEREANEFAENILIPKSRIDELASLRSKSAMVAFASEIGISPGIVAGRYQRLTKRYNYRWLHELIRKFEWAA